VDLPSCRADNPGAIMNIRSRHHVPILGLLPLAALLLLSACGPATHFTGQVLSPAKPAPDLTLTDQRGEQFTLSRQRGNVVLLYFGYTHCPDVCPGTLSVFRSVMDGLGADAQHVRVVFVTVDPERDTAPYLKDYLAQFRPDFIGLTGTLDQLNPVYQAYGIEREQIPAAGPLGYTMTHTSSFDVIDKQGNWRLVHNFGDSDKDIASDVRQLLH
jgi:protein SCO1/2